MKKYSGRRTLKELRAEVKARGWKLDTTKYDEEGSDYVVVSFAVGRVSGYALVSMFNGRFFGELKSGRWFTSDEDKFDSRPWFRELLDLVYTGELKEPDVAQAAGEVNEG